MPIKSHGDSGDRASRIRNAVFDGAGRGGPFTKADNQAVKVAREALTRAVAGAAFDRIAERNE